MQQKPKMRSHKMTQGVYQIRVKGQLDSSRSEWFEGWTITPEEGGTTLLTGRVADQSALHGMLIKIHNLNLPIVVVRCIEPDQEEDIGGPFREKINKGRENK
jgi:hypothetical protein